MRTSVVTTPTGLVVTKRASDDASRVRLRREFEVLSRLRHPNVVEIVRPEACPPIDETDGSVDGSAEPVLVTRFASRSTLADLPPRGPDELADVAESLAQILAELHRLGVAHGSLAPEHCLVAAGGRLVLCSFGRARPVSDPYDVSAAVDAHRLAEMIREWREAMSPRNRGERATLARVDSISRALSRARPDLRRAVPSRLAGSGVSGRHPGPAKTSQPGPGRTDAARSTPRGDRRRRRGIRSAAFRSLLAAALAVVALRYDVRTDLSDLESGVSAAMAVASVLRWAIVAVSSYVAVVSALWAIALAARRPTMTRRLRRLVPAWLEHALVGVTIAGALSTAVNELAVPAPTSITAAPSLRREATITTTSLPETTTTSLVAIDTVETPAPTSLATLEPTTVPVATTPTSRVSTWTVSPGDHFWGIAERTLTEAWGRVPSDRETTRYWRALIAENRSRLADRHNPDLVYIGQVFELPPTPPA
ncbi:MAG TPA: phosphotransferase [Microthrixaceae bacterium]|nr:phosphotransferase [Microthrixaceae bacterium]